MTTIGERVEHRRMVQALDDAARAHRLTVAALDRAVARADDDGDHAELTAIRARAEVLAVKLTRAIDELNDKETATP